MAPPEPGNPKCGDLSLKPGGAKAYTLTIEKEPHLDQARQTEQQLNSLILEPQAGGTVDAAVGRRAAEGDTVERFSCGAVAGGRTLRHPVGSRCAGK